MSKAAAQTLTVDESTRGGEGAHLLDVVGERHRRGADVHIDFEILQRTAAPEVGHRVAVTGRGFAGRPAHPDQTLEANALDQRLEDRKRQPQTFGEIEAGRLATV